MLYLKKKILLFHFYLGSSAEPSQHYLLLSLGFFLIHRGGGDWLVVFQISKSANSLDIPLTKLHSSSRKKHSQMGQRVFEEHQSAGQWHSCTWVVPAGHHTIGGMNKTCNQPLTHTQPSTQTLWHFSPSEIMQEKKIIQANIPGKIILCFTNSVTEGGFIYERSVCACSWNWAFGEKHWSHD